MKTVFELRDGRFICVLAAEDRTPNVHEKQELIDGDRLCWGCTCGAGMQTDNRHNPRLMIQMEAWWDRHLRRAGAAA